MCELKHCPFCGHPPDLEDLDTLYPIDHSGTVWKFTCVRCEAAVLGWTKQEAIDNWNKRV